MSYPYLQQPRPEQLAAMKKIYKMKHALVCGDMGVGKTKIAVDFIANLIWSKKISKALVIVPIEAIGVWEQQISNNCPFINYSLYLSNERVDWEAHIVIINYDYLCPRRKKNQKTMKYSINKNILNSVIEWNPQVVVIDEGHKIKRPTARRSKAVHQLGLIAEYTIDLTGTPTGNKKVMDLWSQFRFIKPDLLSDKFVAFKYRYGIWGGFNNFQLFGTKNVKELFKIIAPYTIRIKKTGLPEKNFIRYPVIMPFKAREIYRQMADDLVASIDQKNIVAPLVLTKMMKLSQIAGGFIKDEKKENHPIHRAKLEALDNILDELENNDTQRVVIFARFLWELGEIKKLLECRGWWVHRVNGRLRPEVQNRFDTQGGAIVCQTASGSGSNNLQAANYMIFYSTDYSLINFKQAQDRIHRIGQTLPCFYYFLQCRGTIDNKIYSLHMENKEVAEEIMSLMQDIKKGVPR
jgi:SNF2 family DNA or RNA helicase